MDNWRSFVHNTVDKFMRPLAKLNISANRISWFSLLLSIFVSLLLRAGIVLLGIVLLFLVLFLDGLDGFIARKKKQTSFNGLVVDLSCDRLSEFIIFYPSIVFIGFATFNSFLAVLRLNNKKFFILPLRHLFLIKLLITFFSLSHII
ncbi:MAG: CDP-alcohol phosphatidyltransferase family protein [Candidatus Aenigmatarchaeota archaeon]